MIGRRLSLDVERYTDRCALHVVPPLCPLDIRPHDFAHAAELIARGYESTRNWLDQGMPATGDQAQVVRPHSHQELAGALQGAGARAAG